MERFAEDAGLLAKVRDYLAKNAVIVSKVIEGKETEGAKFQDYFDHQELLKNVHILPKLKVVWNVLIVVSLTT